VGWRFEPNSEGLVSAAGLGLSAVMDRARMVSMSWYWISVQAVMASPVEEDLVVVFTGRIFKAEVNSGRTYWASPFPLDWVLVNTSSDWIPTSAVTTFVPKMTPSVDAQFLYQMF
jgi:hypothetical protein